MNEGVKLSTGPELLVRVTATGARGKSAYEAARDAGFEGTEREFAAGLAQAAGGVTLENIVLVHGGSAKGIKRPE